MAFYSFTDTIHHRDHYAANLQFDWFISGIGSMIC